MSLNDRLLIKFLTEQISDEDAEAPKGAELERIAFADYRDDKPHEENTDLEESLYNSLQEFQQRNTAIPANHCRLIQKFLANGWYTDMFAAPEVDIVYRLMGVDEKWLRTALNLQEDEDLPKRGISEVPYTYKSRRTCSSWSELRKFPGVPYKAKKYFVVLSAKISDNPPNTFFAWMNKLYNLNDFTSSRSQAEVVSLIPLIKVFKIHWNTVLDLGFFNDDHTLTKITDAAPLPDVNWIKPEIESEIGELERTANELGIDLQTLIKSFHSAKLHKLREDDWITVKNTDSADQSWTLEEIREHLKSTRDFAKIESGIKNGASMPAPIILMRFKHGLYCISGNSRLMACRGYNLTPTVLLLVLGLND